MEWLDWIVVGLYFGLLLGIAAWAIRQAKDTASDYFLAGRNLGWFLVGASIFASNIGELLAERVNVERRVQHEERFAVV